MNCLWFKPIKAAVGKIKQTITYGYDLNDVIYGYKSVTKRIPEFKEKVIDTFNNFKPSNIKTKKPNVSSESKNKTQNTVVSKKTADDKSVSTDNVKQASSSASFIMPLKGVITSGFGNRVNPITKKKEFHEGIDIAASVGTKVHAVADGTVVIARQDDSYGKYVKVKHKDGIYSLYAHLKNINVKQGQAIKQNAVIGVVGVTGETNGPHLHFEIIEDGKNVNPLSVYDAGNI